MTAGGLGHYTAAPGGLEEKCDNSHKCHQAEAQGTLPLPSVSLVHHTSDMYICAR